MARQKDMHQFQHPQSRVRYELFLLDSKKCPLLPTWAEAWPLRKAPSTAIFSVFILDLADREDLDTCCGGSKGLLSNPQRCSMAARLPKIVNHLYACFCSKGTTLSTQEMKWKWNLSSIFQHCIYRRNTTKIPSLPEAAHVGGDQHGPMEPVGVAMLRDLRYQEDLTVAAKQLQCEPFLACQDIHI